MSSSATTIVYIFCNPTSGGNKGQAILELANNHQSVVFRDLDCDVRFYDIREGKSGSKPGFLRLKDDIFHAQLRAKIVNEIQTHPKWPAAPSSSSISPLPTSTMDFSNSMDPSQYGVPTERHSAPSVIENYPSSPDVVSTSPFRKPISATGHDPTNNSSPNGVNLSPLRGQRGSSYNPVEISSIPPPPASNDHTSTPLGPLSSIFSFTPITPTRGGSFSDKTSANGGANKHTTSFNGGINTPRSPKRGPIRVIFAGGDGTITWGMMELTEHDISPADIIVGPLPLGTGNDFARMSGWGSDIPWFFASKNLVAFKRWLIEILQADMFNFDLWEVNFHLRPEGQFFHVKNGKTTVMMDDDDNRVLDFKKMCCNYFSTGLESRIGMGFERNRTRSQTLNKISYGLEGLKKGLLKKQPRISHYVAELVCGIDVQAPPQTQPSFDEMGNIIDAPSSSFFPPIEFKSNPPPVSLIFENIPSMASGCDFWGGSYKYAIKQSHQDKQLPKLLVSPQEIGDGKIEIMTIKALAMYTKAQMGLPRGVAKRVAQSTGPFEIIFKEDYLEKIYFQIDGENYACMNPRVATVSLSRQYQILVRKGCKMSLAGGVSKKMESTRDFTDLLSSDQYASYVHWPDQEEERLREHAQEQEQEQAAAMSPASDSSSGSGWESEWEEQNNNNQSTTDDGVSPVALRQRASTEAPRLSHDTSPYQLPPELRPRGWTNLPFFGTAPSVSPPRNGYGSDDPNGHQTLNLLSPGAFTIRPPIPPPGPPPQETSPYASFPRPLDRQEQQQQPSSTYMSIPLVPLRSMVPPTAGNAFAIDSSSIAPTANAGPPPRSYDAVPSPPTVPPPRPPSVPPPFPPSLPTSSDPAVVLVPAPAVEYSEWREYREALVGVHAEGEDFIPFPTDSSTASPKAHRSSSARKLVRSSFTATGKQSPGISRRTSKDLSSTTGAASASVVTEGTARAIPLNREINSSNNNNSSNIHKSIEELSPDEESRCGFVDVASPPSLSPTNNNNNNNNNKNNNNNNDHYDIPYSHANAPHYI